MSIREDDAERALLEHRQSVNDDFVNWKVNDFRSRVGSELTPESVSGNRRMPLSAEILRQLAEQDASPPSNNMGGNSPEPPLFLSQCEKEAYLVSKQKTKIDWLAFTSSASLDHVKLGIGVLWSNVSFAERSGGCKGYPKALDIIVDDLVYGLIGYGASHERVWVSLPGQASSTLSHEMCYYAADMLHTLSARLTRLDIALDFYEGEVTWDHAMRAYEDTDQFSSTAGGKKPRHKALTGADCDGRNTGRTLYVGQRGESEKFLRIYEKGLEVFAKLPKALRDASESREMVFSLQDEQFADRWLRMEVEFTRQKRDLPLDMLLHRDKYFAGTCPYLANAVGQADGLRPKSLKTQLEVDLIKLIGNSVRSYGSVVHTLKELRLTDAEVVQILSSGRHNNKLIKSGLFAKIKARQDEILATLGPDWDIPF